MQSLNFDEGYKEFSINGDESRTIKFNPSDIGIITRLNNVCKEIPQELQNKPNLKLDEEGKPLDNLENASEMVEYMNNFIKGKIDYIFDYKVSDIVFGNKSPMALVKGEPLYARFLEAVHPILKEGISNEKAKSRKRVEKYTKVVK